MSPAAPSATPFQSTHFVLPAWWVRAFEAAVTAEESGTGASGAMDLAQRAGLAPALTDIELDALAVTLGAVQEQMLSLAPAPGPGRLAGASGLAGTDPQRVVIDLGLHAKHSPSSARSRRFLFEKVAQLLAGMRLLRAARPATSGVAAPVAARAEALFRGDSWSHSVEGGQDRWSLSLEPTTIGAECLIGYADAYAEALRALAGRPEARPLIGDVGPLVVPRSLWLELSPPEQLAFLRLERAMRWEGRWLQLEGVAGMPLARLCAGLRLADVKGAQPQTSAAATGSPSSLAARLRLLARLGKKLTAHGYMAATVNDQYLALDDGDGGAELLVAWQVTPGTVAFDPLPEYRAAASRLALRRPGFDVEALMRLTTSAESRGAARDMWIQLVELAERGGRGDVAAAVDGVELLPGLLASPWLLFFELAQRALAGAAGATPLPSELRQAPGLSAFGSSGVSGTVAAQTAAGLGPAPLGERFESFCRWLATEEAAARTLRDLPWATVASPKTRAEPRWAELKELAFPPGLAASERVGARTAEVSAPRQAKHTAPVTSDADTTRRAPSPAKRGASGAGVSGALASRMLRTATDELGRMRGADPERYKELRQSYLASLDDAGRRLILDVQKRMQPTLFEEHLRQRLVRFMVEHPGSWRSAESQKRLS